MELKRSTVGLHALLLGFLAVITPACLQTVRPELDSGPRSIPLDGATDLGAVDAVDERSDVPRGCHAADWPARGEATLDLLVSRVRGLVQYNAGALPEDPTGIPAARGRLVFSDARQGTSGTIDLGVADDPTLYFPLQNGNYAVRYLPTLTLPRHPETVMPLTGGVVTPSFIVNGESRVTVNIRSVRLRTHATVNGQTFPTWMDAQFSASVGLRNADGVLFPVATFRATPLRNTVEVAVLPGEYSVAYVGPPCRDSLPADLPCGTYSLERTVSVQADFTLDVDIPFRPVNLRGNITANGAAPSPRAASPGTLAFFRPGEETASYSAAVTAGPLSSFALRIPVGTYRLDWIPAVDLCNPLSDALPCSGGVIDGTFSVSDAGPRTIDLRTFRISGAVTRRAAPLPLLDARYGSIRVIDDGQRVGSVPIALRGARVGYELALLRGKYDVVYLPTALVECARGEPIRDAICNQFVARSALELQADTDVAIDLRPVALRLAVQGTGTPLPPNRNVLFGTFTGSKERFPATRIGTQQPQIVQEGEYSIAFDPDVANCVALLDPMQTTPCMTATLLERVAVALGTTVDVRIDAANMHGTVLMNSRPLPDQFREGRGLITLLGASGRLQHDLPIVGPPTFNARLFPGIYTAIHTAADDVCLVGFPSSLLCGVSVGSICAQ